MILQGFKRKLSFAIAFTFALVLAYCCAKGQEFVKQYKVKHGFITVTLHAAHIKIDTLTGLVVERFFKYRGNDYYHIKGELQGFIIVQNNIITVDLMSKTKRYFNRYDIKQYKKFTYTTQQ
jgi:hypothetical protein